MFKVSHYNNDFALELNYIFDAPDGIYFSFLRLRIFIDSVHEQIISSNEKLVSELQKEDPEVYSSMLNQLDIDCSLNYFQDFLLQSIFITSYTLLEYKLRDICLVCGKHKNKNYKEYRKKNGHKSELSAFKGFLEDILNLNMGSLVDSWNKLEDYQKLRKSIIHGESEDNIMQLLKFINAKYQIGIDVRSTNWNKVFVTDFIDKSYYLLDELIKLLNKEYNLISYG